LKVQYIKNGLSSWHTCLLHPGMQPTSNLAEQAIREHVIIRKIIGAFRSERGAENYQYIVSVLATWRLQGKNMSEELENLLRRELCFSHS
jgi:transposase